MYYPLRDLIHDRLQSRGLEEQLKATVDFSYCRRNYYTHEATYPQLGSYPHLSVMQGQRVDVANMATLGEQDRLQPMFAPKGIFFTYYEKDDVITAVRWSVVRGLVSVLGRT